MRKMLISLVLGALLPTAIQWAKGKVKQTPTKVDDNILATVEQAVALIHASGGNAEVIIRRHRKGETIDSPERDA